MHDHGAADRESYNGTERQCLSNLRAQAKHIMKHGNQGTKNSKNVQPSGSAQNFALLAIVQSDLQQKSGQANRGKHHHGKRAMEGARLGVKDD